jgi:sugar O-acyltransferase (sialic acid O-acetyltransferase NeuD family)
VTTAGLSGRTTAETLPSAIAVFPLRSRYAAELAEMLGRIGYAGPVCYVDNLPDGPEPPAVAPVVAAEHFDPAAAGLGIFVSVFPTGLRHRLVHELRAAGATTFPSLVDPSAVVASSATLGTGTTVNALAVVASGTALGSFVTVNRSASIGHDVVVEDFVSFGPACTLTGHVVVGRGAFVGAGAIVLPGVRIGRNAVVGAGAVVTADVETGHVVVGNPARTTRVDDGHGGGVPDP